MPLALSTNSTNVRSPFLRALLPAAVIAVHRARFRVASFVAPGKAVDLASRLFATPPRHGHTDAERAALAQASRHEVSMGFQRLAAWRFGPSDRPVVVASHGWGGRGAQFRAFVPALLEAGYQVVVFDHVGHGESDGRESSLIHFIDGLDAVVRDAESRGAKVVALLGHSLGAAAIGAWLNRNRREMDVVLVAPPTSIERYSGHFARRLGIPEKVRRAMQERFERVLGRRWSEFELPHAVAQVRARALIVHDVEDADVPFAAGLALARAWPSASLLPTRGLGHRRVLRDPVVIRDALDFIARRVVFSPPPPMGGRPFDAPSPVA